MADEQDPIHLAISQSGHGPTVVFTHGWVDTRHAWDGVIHELGNQVHSTSWDLRGHGDSEVASPGHYTREDALGDLERVVVQAGTPCVLAGHSLGGYLSLAYALSHPEQVRGLVLIAAGPGFRKDEAREQWNRSVDVSALKLDVPEGSGEISKHVDAWVIDNLTQISAPALVLVGEYDKRFQASAAVFGKTLDVRANVVVDDAGHSVHKKQPAVVAAAIRDFLSEIA